MKIAIIGCGTMGRAFAERLTPNHDVFLYNRNLEKAKELEKLGHGKAFDNLADAVMKAEVVILAVKPQHMPDVAKEVSFKPPAKQVLISLLTGTTTTKLKDAFPHDCVVRLMPNLAILCGAGMIGVVTARELDPEENKKVETICQPLGKMFRIKEEMMNPFTALAGSGPAFVYALVEALIASGVDLGYSAEESGKIVQQMMSGSLALWEASKKQPSDLMKQIAPPGGTTEAGLKVFKEKSIHDGLRSVFRATFNRAQELQKL